MEKSQSGDIFYEELKSDEKILLQWFRENPASVYIEISLIKLEEWGIITKNEYKRYQSEVVKGVAILKEMAGDEVRDIMGKDKLKDFIFKILNENDEIFSDVSLDDETDTIFLTVVGGKRFIVTVSPVTADEAILELWAKKNPELMSIAIGVIYMRDLGVFTEEETDKYLSEIVKKAK